MKELWDYNKKFSIEKERKLGNTYTHPVISHFIADNIPKKFYKNILDPSVGTGSFYYAVNDTKIKYKTYDCYDISQDALNSISKLNNCNLYNEDFLTKKITKKYNLIITNPPYISSKNIPKGIFNNKFEYIECIKNSLDYDKLGITRDSISKNSDIYVYFYLKALSLLEDDGILVFLCADTWLETKYGEVLKKVLSKNFNMDRLITSNFYPFFSDDTNAICTFISKVSKNSKTILNSIKTKDFKLVNKIITRTEFIQSLYEVQPKNKIIYYPEEYNFTKKFNAKYNLVQLKTLITVEPGTISFNNFIKSNKITETKKSEKYIKLFHQKQSRVNKPAVYKENIFSEDLKYYIKKEDNKVYNSGVFYTPGIYLFPRVFTYQGKCCLSSKYVKVESNKISEKLLPIFMNNIVTLLNIECFIKNGTKKSSTKNKRGVTKETSLGKLLDLYSLDFSIITEEQMNILLKYYDKYRNNTFLTLDDALNDENYMKVQKYLFEIFGIPEKILKEVIENLKQMYYIRLRDLKALGLELIDL